jgi:hypothetical protein
MKLLVIALLLSACMPTQHYIHQRQTLLFGSDSAIYAGCVRGVIRWQVARTGNYPIYADVQALCTNVQKSFMEKWSDNGDV